MVLKLDDASESSREFLHHPVPRLGPNESRQYLGLGGDPGVTHLKVLQEIHSLRTTDSHGDLENDFVGLVTTGNTCWSAPSTPGTAASILLICSYLMLAMT